MPYFQFRVAWGATVWWEQVATHFAKEIPFWKKESEVAQSCPTLCDPMDCSLPGSSVHGIFQARILEWIAIPSSRGSSQPKDWTWVSRIAGRCNVWRVECKYNVISLIYAFHALEKITIYRDSVRRFFFFFFFCKVKDLFIKWIIPHLFFRFAFLIYIFFKGETCIK